MLLSWLRGRVPELIHAAPPTSSPLGKPVTSKGRQQTAAVSAHYTVVAHQQHTLFGCARVSLRNARISPHISPLQAHVKALSFPTSLRLPEVMEVYKEGNKSSRTQPCLAAEQSPYCSPVSTVGDYSLTSNWVSRKSFGCSNNTSNSLEMDDPVRDITGIITTLCTGPPSVQRQAVETYFTPTASFTHPLCRTGSFNGSRWFIAQIYRWYKIMSPRIDIKVDGVCESPDSAVCIVVLMNLVSIRRVQHGPLRCDSSNFQNLGCALLRSLNPISLPSCNSLKMQTHKAKV